MLSVLIPIYNFDVTNLVKILHKQLKLAEIDFEIILLDDASWAEFKARNSLLAEIESVTYTQLLENVGRANIRNKLAGMSNFNYLLFLDCDSYIISDSFIQSYVSHCCGERAVCGGRVYSTDPPENSCFYLHWRYGTKRESIPVDVREKNPYKSFMTNNFMISKSIFKKIQFDQKITSYGHEDTLFGFHLREHNVPVLHIRNPVLHKGLEPVNLFLSKTRSALVNLKYVYETYKNNYSFIKSVRILSVYHKIKKWRITGFFILLHKLCSPSLLFLLKRKHPSLALLALYKFFYLCSLKIKTK